jgi:quinol monooxygenase YgiN
MWGKRQQDDEDWNGDRRDQPADRREQRPDDRRGNGYWADADDWGGPGAPGGGAPGGNGHRQGFGDVDRQGFGDPGRPGFGDGDRQGVGESPWGEPRRARGDYGDGSFGGPGFGDIGRDSGRDLGFGGARQADPRSGDPRSADSWQGDQWQSDARPGDSRRPARDFPEAGFGQQPGYGGGRGGDFGGGDYRGGDRREVDRRDLDRRDLDRRDGGGSRGEAGSWAPPEPELPAPMFTPTPQAASAAPALGSSRPGSSGGSAGTRPYGRLLIFTLHDDGVAEFDRLAEQAAEGVRANEPDTLVYVMHVVPKAPMQRIIYEIYRDHAAFEAHQRQPHIQQFEDGRKSCVLVTNIIDLRLKYAKVAPLQGAGQPNGSQPNGSQQGPGARHRGPQALEPEGEWFGESVGSRSPDLDGGWGAERGFDSGDRRSQDWGSSQYTGQRHRNN